MIIVDIFTKSNHNRAVFVLHDGGHGLHGLPAGPPHGGQSKPGGQHGAFGGNTEVTLRLRYGPVGFNFFPIVKEV